MNNFTLCLQDSTRTHHIEEVSSFVGEDSSGSFGILANHIRMMTTLVIGLARFQVNGGQWQWLALPGAVLYFHDNVLTLSTRRYLLDDDYNRISQALQEQLLGEEEQLHAMKESLQRMEKEVLKRLWELNTNRGRMSHVTSG
ncbi:F0F1 ATP synthase subunit epsilon [Porticoccus sp.]